MKTPPADMLAAAKAVLPYAYTPYSHFPVAAVMRINNGKIFSGCNIENASFSLTLCAEAVAIAALIAEGHKTITEALVLVPGNKICSLCGACRQRLLEFASFDTVIHLCTLQNDYQHYTLAQLLPVAFGPKNLDEKTI